MTSVRPRFTRRQADEVMGLLDAALAAPENRTGRRALILSNARGALRIAISGDILADLRPDPDDHTDYRPRPARERLDHAE